MNNAERARLPIGVFDSGVGGLTVLRALTARLPGEDILYLGDTARLPYGTKSAGTISRYALQCASQLAARGIKLLVVACNTASATALEALTQAWPGMPVIGVVEPGAAAACAASASGSICVIATASTIKGKAYHRAISRLRPEARVTGLSCGLFVSLAEEGWFDGPEVEAVARRYLAPVFLDQPNGRPDCLVLGCTHFPLLERAIRAAIDADAAGVPVRLVDSAATTAEVAAARLDELGLRGPRERGAVRFFTTDDPVGFAATGSRFFGADIPITHVELVDLTA